MYAYSNPSFVNMPTYPSNSLLTVLHQYATRVPFLSNPLPILCDARKESATAQAVGCVCAAGQCAQQNRHWPYLATLITRLADLGPVSQVCGAIGISLQACPWLISDSHIPYQLALSFAFPALFAAVSLRICLHPDRAVCTDCAAVLLASAESRYHDAFAMQAAVLCRSVTRALQFASDCSRENILARMHDFVHDHFIMFAGFRYAPMDAALADKHSPIRALLTRFFLSSTMVIASSLTSDPIAVSLATDCLSLLEFARVRFSGYPRLFALLVNEGLQNGPTTIDEYIDKFLPTALPEWNPVLVRYRNFFVLSILQVWVIRCSHEIFDGKLLPYITSFFKVRDTSCNHKSHVIFSSRFALHPILMRAMAPRYSEIVLETYPNIINGSTLRHVFGTLTRSLPEDDPILIYVFNLLILRAQELVRNGVRDTYLPAVECSASSLLNLHSTFIDQGLRLFDGFLDAVGHRQLLDILSVLQTTMSGAVQDVTIKDTLMCWYLQTLARFDVKSNDVTELIRSRSRPDKPTVLVVV